MITYVIHPENSAFETMLRDSVSLTKKDKQEICKSSPQYQPIIFQRSLMKLLQILLEISKYIESLLLLILKPYSDIGVQ